MMLILALIMFIGYFVQTITGFGSTLIILTLGILFFQLYEILPIVLLLNVIMCFSMVLIHYKNIEYSFLLKNIFSYMGLGFVIGLWTTQWVQKFSLPLNKLFAGLIFILSLFEFFLLYKNKSFKIQNPIFARFWVFISGIVHAIFATGGPFLVYGISHYNIDKFVFRISLIFVWLIFDSLLLIHHSINLEQFKTSLFMMLVLPVSMGLGHRVYEKISVEHFQLFIRGILIVSTLIILLK
jgi:hypothetical protein